MFKNQFVAFFCQKTQFTTNIIKNLFAFPERVNCFVEDNFTL